MSLRHRMMLFGTISRPALSAAQVNRTTVAGDECCPSQHYRAIFCPVTRWAPDARRRWLASIGVVLSDDALPAALEDMAATGADAGAPA